MPPYFGWVFMSSLWCRGSVALNRLFQKYNSKERYTKKKKKERNVNCSGPSSLSACFEFWVLPVPLLNTHGPYFPHTHDTEQPSASPKRPANTRDTRCASMALERGSKPKCFAFSAWLLPQNPWR
mmetsp:Transcript_2555/g.5235  ORF Transcript_2555/g.5235 Transcript_2555/m.5235 type:complete len:125 (+) Transcript_2555:213-587(+)